MTLFAVALAVGALTVSAPPGAAQVMPSLTPPVAATPPVSVGSGTTRGSLVMAIESPTADQQLHTDRDFLIIGYALDRSATMHQGVQGSGMDRVQLFMDGPSGTPMANAELGFSDANAARFGSQFGNSGFRLQFHPGDFPAGSHNLYVVAHSVVSGQLVEMLYWISITTEPSGGRRNRSVADTGGIDPAGSNTPTLTLALSSAAAISSASPATTPATQTGTPTMAEAATSTPTLAPSATPSASATATLTPTATDVPTVTLTPTQTSTPTSTSTPTATATPTNVPPDAVDDRGATTEDAVLRVPAGSGVLSNDTDPDSGDTRTVVAVSGGTVGTAFTTAKQAALTVNADGSFVYDPTVSMMLQALRAGTSETDSVTYTVQDARQGQDSATLTITITGLNDAPTGTDTAVTILEDAAHTFTAANFGFTDPIDSPANALQAVRITTLPAAGTLTLSSIAVTEGQSIPAADIGDLVFTPVANANGTPYASFTFQVQDDGGTADGGMDLDPTPNTFTINVTSVNDAPSGTNTAVTTDANGEYTFTRADFGFTDPNDTPPNMFDSVQISRTPGDGTLTLDGFLVQAGEKISQGSIAQGGLRYVPPAPGMFRPSSTTFRFKVEDDGGVDNGGVAVDPSEKTMTINITPLN